jgi:hypothetical protein
MEIVKTRTMTVITVRKNYIRVELNTLKLFTVRLIADGYEVRGWIFDHSLDQPFFRLLVPRKILCV